MAAEVVKAPEIRYEKRDGYEIYPVTGAFGGPTPKGDSILCQFFFEHVIPPDTVPLEPVPGQPGSFRDAPITGQRGVRLLQTGIYLTPQQAKSIGQWLINHADSILNPSPEQGND